MSCPIMLSSMALSCPLEGRLVDGSVLTVAYGAISNALTNPLIEGTGYFPFTQTRLYVPHYELANPTALINDQVKKIKYIDCYVQMFDKKASLGVKTDGTQLNTPFNLQASGSFRNIKYVALLPFAETSAGNYVTAHGVPQYQSPMDSAPGTLHPGSAIRSFQVQIDGDSVFNSSKDYDFSSFREEITKLSAINEDLDNRLNCSLLNEQQWSNANRFLLADCSRLTHPDVPASVVVSGINASAQGSDLLLLIVYERELSLDVLTSEIYRAD